MAGRPCRLDKEPGLIDAICEHIRAGSYPDVAAAAEGVPERTFYRWKAQGEDDWLNERDTPQAAFWQSVTRAIAQSEVDMIREARVDSRAGAQQLLPRRFADRWGNKIDVRVREQAVDHVLDRLREGLDQETLGRVLQILAADEGEGAVSGDGATTH